MVRGTDAAQRSAPPDARGGGARAFALALTVHLLLVATLPLAAVVAIGPLLTGGLIGAALLWTFAYVRRARQQVRAMQPNPPREAEASSSDGDRQPVTATR